MGEESTKRGNPKRCSKCKGLGNNDPELEGLCRRCYENKMVAVGHMPKSVFEDKLFEFNQISIEGVQNALREVVKGKSKNDIINPKHVKVKDRRTVISFCERRMRNKTRRHIVREETPLGEAHEIPEDYALVREGPPIER